MSFETATLGEEPTAALQLDRKRLSSYLTQTLPQLFPASSEIDILQLTHGQSNPTYVIQVKEESYVLRKKPPGKLLHSAHQIEREVQVLKALESTDVPVPRVIHFCPDDHIIGTAFYLMEHIKGTVYTDPNMLDLSPRDRGRAYRSIADALAKLHKIDADAVGLGQFGKTQGYCQRQIGRWWKQYINSTSTPSILMKKLKDWLEAHIPERDQIPSKPIIAHGDPSMANLIFKDGKLAALIDWELCTLGDCWADVAFACMSYYYPKSDTLPQTIDPLVVGVPSESEFVSIYALLRKVSIPLRQDWAFYKALALFRLASICQGVGARAKQGNAASVLARELGSPENVDRLAKQGLRMAQTLQPKDPTLVSSLDVTGYQIRPHAKELITKVADFMETFIFPLDSEVEKHGNSEDRWKVFPKMEELKNKAQELGLWNLFIPRAMGEEIRKLEGLSEQEKESLSGPGLTNLEYCFLAEIMGQCPWASEVFNCNAPDTGNMEILSKFGTQFQKTKYLIPLLKGLTRSCFGMTEKSVASSDARNVQSSILRSGDDEVVLTGKKWWTSGALHPNVDFCIFMGKSDTSRPAYRQQTMVLVPMSTPGIQIQRPMLLFAYDDAPAGHPEIDFFNVKVSSRNILGVEGQGFEIAQSRLGPGRLHHCMRLIGIGKRALEITKERLQTRVAFGGPLSHKSSVQQTFGSLAVDLRAARLLVLSAAESLDRLGGKLSRFQISAAKVFVPKTVAQIVDSCIQFHGGGGFSDDYPLARMYAIARSLRVADGPEEVHLSSVGKSELSDFDLTSKL